MIQFESLDKNLVACSAGDHLEIIIYLAIIIIIFSITEPIDCISKIGFPVRISGSDFLSNPDKKSSASDVTNVNA